MNEPSHRGLFTALSGALLVVGIGGAGVLMLLGVGAPHGNLVGIRSSLALAAMLVTGGAAGGMVFGATRALRGRGWAATTASWCLSGWSALLVLVLVGRSVSLTATPGRLGAERVAILLGGPAVAYLALAVLLFSMVMAHAATTDERDPLLVGWNDTAPRGSILTWLAIALLGRVVFFVATRDTSLPVPNDAAEARQVLADARAEAKLLPDDAHTQFVLGLALSRLGRIDESRAPLERAVRLDPEDAWAQHLLGWTLNQQKRYAEAMPHLREAIRLVPDYGDAHHAMAYAHLALGHLRAAEVEYANAARLKPHEAEAASDYAWVLERRGNTAMALAQRVRAVRLEPGNMNYHAALADVLHRQARFSEARAHLIEALHLDASPAYLWGALGVTDYLMHDAPGADSAFAEAARRDSQYFRLRPPGLAMWQHAQRGSTAEIRDAEVPWSVLRDGSTRHER